MTDRRLIEDSLPLAEISEQSAQEKYIRQGHISTLHMWWARRPLAAARAAVDRRAAAGPRQRGRARSSTSSYASILDWDLARIPRTSTWRAPSSQSIAERR